MKLIDIRKQIKNTFSEKGIEESDADFIISEVLGVKRTELALIDEITDKDEKTIREKVELRLKNIPIDIIFGKTYFYGLELEVNRDVLTPRSESELIVDYALKYIEDKKISSVLDMCTGSGCLAIAVKKNAEVKVTAVDISDKALATAKRNAKKHNVDIEFIKSNMFEKVLGKFDIIISNPPYIDTDEIDDLSREVVENDPILALDGGNMGLKFYNILHDNLKKYLTDDGIMIIEIGENQREMISNLFADCTLLDAIEDYAGHDRVMVFRK